MLGSLVDKMRDMITLPSWLQRLVEIAEVVVVELSKLVVSLADTEDVNLSDVQIILYSSSL